MPNIQWLVVFSKVTTEFPWISLLSPTGCLIFFITFQSTTLFTIILFWIAADRRRNSKLNSERKPENYGNLFEINFHFPLHIFFFICNLCIQHRILSWNELFVTVSVILVSLFFSHFFILLDIFTLNGAKNGKVFLFFWTWKASSPYVFFHKLLFLSFVTTFALAH